jgi:hypothetical protein
MTAPRSFEVSAAVFQSEGWCELFHLNILRRLLCFILGFVVLILNRDEMKDRGLCPPHNSLISFPIGWTVRGSNPGGVETLCAVQIGLAVHPVSCTLGTASFPGVKRPGVVSDYPLPSSAGLRMDSSYNSTSPLCIYKHVIGWPLPLFSQKIVSLPIRLCHGDVFLQDFRNWSSVPSSSAFQIPRSSSYNVPHCLHEILPSVSCIIEGPNIEISGNEWDLRSIFYFLCCSIEWCNYW